MKEAVVRYDEPAGAATAWFLAAGVATYVVGLVALRAVLRTGPLTGRLGVAAAAVPTVVVGLAISPEWQIATLTLVVAGGIVAESRRRQPSPTS